MNNVSMFLLFLFVAVCSAARFPFEPRDPSAICADCRGLSPASVVGCYCSDLHHCEAAGCTNFGGCSFADCDNTPARRALKHRSAEHRVLQAMSRREPSDCPDCRGFGPGCPCDAQKYCHSQGCETGQCISCTKKRTVMADYLPKREPNDCPDCRGFGAGCPCDAHDYCMEACGTAGACTDNCGKRKRTIADFLKKREPNDCPDCKGFEAGCPCDALDICESEKCSDTGGCTRDNCGKKKRTISDLLKRGEEICYDCKGFGPGCPCGDALLCAEECGEAGECKSSNCSPTA